MTTFFPDSVQTIGKDLWMWLTVGVNKAALTVAELTGATTVQLQNAMRPGFGLQAETANVDDVRLGSFVTYGGFGRTTRSFPAGVFIDRPQTTTGDASRKHIETITEGLTGWLVNRRGLGSAVENYVAWAATQKYLIYPVVAGPQTFTAIPEEGGQFEYTQDFKITGPVIFGIAAA